MARRKRRNKTVDPEAVASGRTRIDMEGMFRLIHQVNPTERGLAPAEEQHRYALKARLQSRLIERYGDLLLADTVAEDPGVVSLAHRSGQRDACHARIDALDTDARLWLRRQHAVRELVQQAEARPQSPSRKQQPITAPHMDDSAGGTYEAGLQALDAYDYEAARAHFEAALDGGEHTAEAARALMELLVDHLAMDEDSIALSSGLPTRLGTDEKVRTLTAKALARQDRYEEAKVLLQGLHGEDAALAWKRVGRAALRLGDFDAVERSILGIRDADPAHPAAVTIADALAGARAASRAPMEAQLKVLADSGCWNDAEQAAQHILKEWPRSKVARSVLTRIERHRQARQLDELRSEAIEREKTGDLEGAIALLERALKQGDASEAIGEQLERLWIAHADEQLRLEVVELVNAYAKGVDEGRRRWLTASSQAQVQAKPHVNDPQLAEFEQLAARLPKSRRPNAKG